jgi:glycolate dehydrogenase iron-sulfur subunit
VLAAAGLDVHAPPGAVCCGSLHAHNGELAGARRLARATVEAFEGLCNEGGTRLAVAVNSAGCGAHMKAYGELFEPGDAFRPRAEAFAARVRDLSEVLADAAHADALGAALATPPAGIESPLAFDDPCHLCHGQGVRAEPRALLDRLPGVRRVELEGSELCCGSAGIYALLRPADSAAILAPKLAALQRSGARTLVTANPGCQIQWESGVRRAGLGVRVVHLAEVLERALQPPNDAARST